MTLPNACPRLSNRAKAAAGQVSLLREAIGG